MTVATKEKAGTVDGGGGRGVGRGVKFIIFAKYGGKAVTRTGRVE
jgi:hypothetical protein